MKISLVIPSIHPENWLSLFQGMQTSCLKNSFEIIFVGPYPVPSELSGFNNVKYIKDLGCPSRCLQLGSTIAEGTFLSWCSDDCQIQPGAFDEAIETFEQNLTDSDGINLLYSEGENFTGTQHLEKSYWIGYTHPDLRCPGVNPEWSLAIIFLYKRHTFYKFGGVDCRFEHANMNLHDLAFAIQNSGGKIINSKSLMFKFNFNPNVHREEYRPVYSAYLQNDGPLFKSLYQDPQAASKRAVSMDNWRNQDSVWKRRF